MEDSWGAGYSQEEEEEGEEDTDGIPSNVFQKVISKHISCAENLSGLDLRFHSRAGLEMGMKTQSCVYSTAMMTPSQCRDTC